MSPRPTVLDLNTEGKLLHPSNRTPLTAEEIPPEVERHLRLDPKTTDIFLYVHGWRTKPDGAAEAAQRLFTLTEDLLEQQPHHYPRLRPFHPRYICVRWPSHSAPTPSGYRTIRDRAASMSDPGHAPRVLAAILGYYNKHRHTPEPGPDTLRTAKGQYLHAIGHSFGGRFLTHAIAQASNKLSQGPHTLGWAWRNNAYPWTLDSLTVFQMALPHDAFAQQPYSRLLADNVLNAPIAMTFSPYDRALGLWHRRTEDQKDGIGYNGATTPIEHLHTLPLHTVADPYEFPASRLINIDASSRYRSSPLKIEGAHSDYFHRESAHLLLSLANQAR
ncbi:hypothetical protein [Streptomyces sp.]|uniref:hypothetical protein n=1 Tax=Streptomyces sp. TaxID=1931 RepID=UPI002D7712D8|nr:hypothetical protein [Streptomyces sp.]HET6354882.1 hypothetical protein [Streptomyces sp.]